MPYPMGVRNTSEGIEVKRGENKARQGDCIAMKSTYESELRSLQSWINNVNNGLASGMPIVIDPNSAKNTCYQINAGVYGIEGEYSFYTKELKNISMNLLSVLRVVCFI